MTLVPSIRRQGNSWSREIYIYTRASHILPKSILRWTRLPPIWIKFTHNKCATLLSLLAPGLKGKSKRLCPTWSSFSTGRYQRKIPLQEPMAVQFQACCYSVDVRTPTDLSPRWIFRREVRYSYSQKKGRGRAGVLLSWFLHISVQQRWVLHQENPELLTYYNLQ